MTLDQQTKEGSRLSLSRTHRSEPHLRHKLRVREQGTQDTLKATSAQESQAPLKVFVSPGCFYPRVLGASVLSKNTACVAGRV